MKLQRDSFFILFLEERNELIQCFFKTQTNAGGQAIRWSLWHLVSSQVKCSLIIISLTPILIVFTTIICENDNFIWGQTTHGKISTILIKLVKTRLMNKNFISSPGAGVSELKSRRVLSELRGRVQGGVANNCKGWRRHSGGTAPTLITQNMIYTHRIISGHLSKISLIILGDLILTMIAVISIIHEATLC